MQCCYIAKHQLYLLYSRPTAVHSLICAGIRLHCNIRWPLVNCCFAIFDVHALKSQEQGQCQRERTQAREASFAVSPLEFGSCLHFLHMATMLMHCLARDQICKGNYSFCLPKYTTLCHEFVRPTTNKEPDGT